jgi:hypothetical protein
VFGVPPPSHADFAWVQHFIHHLAPTGLAGFVVANGGELSQVVGGSAPETEVDSYWIGGCHPWAIPTDLSGLRTHVLLDTERMIAELRVKDAERTVGGAR